MKIRTKEIYNCEHCNKLYLRKKSCEIHEKYCMKNPENIPRCFGCEFLEKEESDNGKGEDFRYFTPQHFYCKKKSKVMHPIKLQSKIDRNYITNEDILDFLEETESELMPKECEVFEPEKILNNPFGDWILDD